MSYASLWVFQIVNFIFFLSFKKLLGYLGNLKKPLLFILKIESVKHK